MSQLTTPLALRASYRFWIGAIITAIAELFVRLIVADGGFAGAIAQSLPELGIRCMAYCLLLILSSLMLTGRQWARLALLLIFGGLGTASLVAEPFQWLAQGGSIAGFLTSADLATWLMGTNRVLHIVCIWTGVVLMYLPTADVFLAEDTVKAT